MKLAVGADPISDEDLEALAGDSPEKLMEKVVKLERMRIFLERLQAWRCPWEH